MEFITQLQDDPTERRRLQNRIAQRKFRQRKQQALQSSNDGLNAYPTPPAPAGDHCSSSPRYSPYAPAFSALPPLLSTPRSEDDSLGFDFDADTINQWLCDANSSNSSSFSLDDAYITAQWPSSASTNTLQRSLTHHPDPSQPLPPPRTADASLTNKGWLGTVHIAAQKGHDRIVSILLQRGAVDPDTPDSDARTPLFHAAVEDHLPVVQTLLRHGAQLRRLDAEGRSVLHWAVLYRRLRVLQALLEHWRAHEREWFSINAYDNVGWTPLHLAVERGFEEGVLLLMNCGADINAKAKRCPETGKPIPFHIAQQMG